jgi:hydrogenase nickel insertion protein HypA
MQKIPRLSFIIDNLFKQPARVVSVNLAVGELALFTEDEIQAEWSALVRNTPLSQAELVIHHIPVEQQCMACFQKYKPADKATFCPYCGCVGAKILAGEEFYLESVRRENE